MDLIVVDYLRTHSFNQLEADHGVCVRFGVDGMKASLNYNMLTAKKGDVISEQCRGVVVRARDMKVTTNPSWKDEIVGEVQVLAWPMNRFYNMGDIAAAFFCWDAADVKIFEKLDGTCIIMYWDPAIEKWCAGTRAVCEADLPIRKDDVNIGNATFSDLFFKVLGKIPEGLSKEHTYVFELTSLYNQIVVRYETPGVTLLAIKETATGKEVSTDVAFEWFEGSNATLPLTWSINNLGALEAFVDSANPAQLEGAVVLDSSFNRIKVKNKAWVLSSRAKDLVTVSRRSALLAIIKGEIDDVIPLVSKEIADDLEDIQTKIVSYARGIDERYVSFKNEAGSDRKTFAWLVMQGLDWHPPYFKLWEGKVSSTMEYLQDLAENEKMGDNVLDVLLTKSGAARSNIAI